VAYPTNESESTIRLGAPLLQELKDPLELAQAHAALGYRAAFCPSDLSTNDIPRIHAVRRAFREHDILIAEVIAWRNLIPRDNAMRAAAYDFVCERLALADEVGARCCVTFGGTLDLDTSWTPHPDNLSRDTFDLIVGIVRNILDDVKPSRTLLVLEMMATVFPNSADSYLALIEAVDRPGLGVHLDPVNLITSPRHYWNSGALIEECFDKLGRWLASAHAKDIIWRPERGFHLAETIPGRGVLDFRTYLSRLKQLSRDVPLMLEHLHTTDEYRRGYDHIRSIQVHLEGGDS
jgi:sugar phosphate isomerase/epimerase